MPQGQPIKLRKSCTTARQAETEYVFHALEAYSLSFYSRALNQGLANDGRPNRPPRVSASVLLAARRGMEHSAAGQALSISNLYGFDLVSPWFILQFFLGHIGSGLPGPCWIRITLWEPPTAYLWVWPYQQTSEPPDVRISSLRKS
jgi:hypothetical protein